MKFSIRDLFLVTLSVALTLGWWVDRQRRPQELIAAKKWKTSAGALEEALRDLGWTIEWEVETVHLRQGNRTISVDRTVFEPSPPSPSRPQP